MTEREERQTEVLFTLKDYIEQIKELDELAGDVANGDKIDKYISQSIKSVAQALNQKVKYIVSISKKYRKKQSLLSVKKDLKIEQEQAQQEALFNLMKEQQLTAIPEPAQEPPKGFLAKVKALFSRKGKTMAISLPKEPENEKQEALECDETEEQAPDVEIVDPEEPESEAKAQCLEF